MGRLSDSEMHMRDAELLARTFAKAEAKNLAIPPELRDTYVENRWHRLMDAAVEALHEVDAERLRRALFNGGDLARSLVTTEAGTVSTS